MATATLSRWGNSQGFRIPKEDCEALGLGLGDQVDIVVDAPSGRLILQRPQGRYRTYTRSEKVSLETLMGDYHGPKVGEEWSGPDVGAEVVD